MTTRFYSPIASVITNFQRSQPAPLTTTPEHETDGEYLFTLIAAIVLSTFSIICLASGMAKFSRVLALTPQTHVEVPEQLTREALSHLD